MTALLALVLSGAALLLLLLLLLTLPLELAFRLRRHERFEGRLEIRGLRGLLRLGFDVGGPGQSAEREAAPQPGRGHRAKRHRSGSRGGLVGRAWQDPALRRRLTRLLLELVHELQWHELRLWARLGLGDPADTGRLWALLGPLGAAAQSLRLARITIEPDFVNAAFEFETQGRLLLRPLRVLGLGLLLGFALSPPARRVWRSRKVAHA